MKLMPGYKKSEAGVIPADWRDLPFAEVLQKLNAKKNQIQTSEYLDSGMYPVVDQGQNLVTAYSNEDDKILSPPAGGVIVFGDHTCIVKFIPFAFIVGADGTQILRTKAGQVAQFHSYALMYRGVEATGYNRHFKFLKERFFQSPPLEEQRAIAEALGDMDALLGALDRLIAKKRDIKQAAMQQLLTGQTRLPGFSGEWEIKRLGDVGKCLRGVSYKGDNDLWNHDTPRTKRLLRSNNVQDAIIIFDDVQFVNDARVSTHQILQEDDILICMANGSKSLVGKAGRFKVTDSYEYTFGAFMGCFRTNQTAAIPAFIFYLFLTDKYRDYVNNLLAGSSINNLRPSNIESLEFLTPTHAEQTAIATVLSDMDAELEALEQRRAKTAALKQGMMQELLTGRTRLV
jgi:type I restriction enzyme S subunit